MGLQQTAARDQAADPVVEKLRTAPKYRGVHIDTIRDVVQQEASAARDPRDLERRARIRLHRCVATFLNDVPCGALVAELERGALGGGSEDEIREWCRRALATHASSRERLPDLAELYPRLLDLIEPVTTIADMACALNVLSLPWLRDRFTGGYVGYDFNLATVELGRAFAARADANARMVHADLLVTPALVREDAALLLKTYHCLEIRRPGAGLHLLDEIGSPTVVVSLPRRSLSGRPLGFATGHGERLRNHASARGWTIRELELSTEVFWAITR